MYSFNTLKSKGVNNKSMNIKSKVYLLIVTCFATVILLFFIYKNTNKNIVYKPKISNEVLINPFMGWAPDAKYKDYIQPHSLVYANLYWSDLEPSKGIYDFKNIEKKFNFDYWKSKNVKMIIRLVLDYPNKENSMQIPKWLYNEIGGDGTWYDISYGKGFSPNYENKTLIYYHEKLIKALGERYNSSSEIAFIELGSIGHWGEWHTYEDDKIKLKFPDESSANEYVKPYLKYFSNKIMMMRRPFKIAKQNNFGLFNDMIGDKNSTDEFLSWVNNGYYNDLLNTDEPKMKDFWKRAPSGGEFAYGDQSINYFKKFSIESTIDQLKTLHTTFIGPNCPADRDNTYKESYDRILNTLGYKFVIEESKYFKSNFTNNINIKLKIQNKGVASFYFNWPIEIVLIDKDNQIKDEILLKDDIRNWLPGENIIKANIELDKNLEKGEYTLALGILDPSTQKASIKFGNDEEVLLNYFKIGSITI